MTGGRLYPVLAVAVAGLLAACQPPRPRELRLESENLRFQISSDPLPPYAREPAIYKVIVRDKRTREPIEGGEGQIYASSRDRVNIYDALTPGPELGSYYGTLRFVTAGEWAVAVRFRRDSLRPLETVEWYQEIRAARDEPDIVD